MPSKDILPHARDCRNRVGGLHGSPRAGCCLPERKLLSFAASDGLDSETWDSGRSLPLDQNLQVWYARVKWGMLIFWIFFTGRNMVGKYTEGELKLSNWPECRSRPMDVALEPITALVAGLPGRSPKLFSPMSASTLTEPAFRR